MKINALILFAALACANELAHAQVGALKYGNSAAAKYCEARKQGRPHSNALQLAMMDGTAASRKYSAQQGSVVNQNAQVDFNKYINSMCPEYIKDFGEGGIQSTVSGAGTEANCLSSLDIYNGVQTGVISKRCGNGWIEIQVHR